jgi:NADH-quinone oxidoreductase subunit N
MLVLLISVDFSVRFQAGVTEFFALVLFALVGMMFAASANDFVLMFVALELITVTFYVLNSFQRAKLASLEAGVKYLILGATASAFMVFGIALIFGGAATTNFTELYLRQAQLADSPVFLAGLLLVLVGLGFKIAAFPFQIWAPDVYQGAPAPAVAFLAVGSKAAGFALLLRVLFGAVPMIAARWSPLLVTVSAVTILYGSLCAIPQRSLKRLMGYSSIANAGFVLLGVAAVSKAGSTAVLYYLAGYLVTTLAAFAVLAVVIKETDGDDISALAGLGRRSPLLATALTLSMVSLAGVPPTAGFFGKFLLLQSVVASGAQDRRFLWLAAIAVIGVVISLYYYFGVVRAMFWSRVVPETAPIRVTYPIRFALLVCMAGIIYLGVAPDRMMGVGTAAVEVLKPEAPVALHAVSR